MDDVPVTDDINEKHKACQLTPEHKKKEEVLSLEEKIEDDEKEEGEITHDSDDDENIENLLVKKTPVKTNIRSKSSLESDCRSPLLIESSEPFFEKSLSSELAVMAAKNNAGPRQRKPLGEVKTESNDDSLLIWKKWRLITYRTRAIISRSWIQAIHKDKNFWKNLLKNKEMVFENGVKNIQAAAYNGARTV